MIINNIGVSRRDADTLNGLASTAFATAAQGAKADAAAIANGTNATGTWPISITGNAATATKLLNARTITVSGDVNGSITFDGSTNGTLNLTFAAAAASPIATKLATSRTFTIKGGASSAPVAFDGTKDVEMNVTVDPSQHQHTIAHVTDLANQLALINSKIEEIDVVVTGGVIDSLGDAATKNTGVNPGQVPLIQINGKIAGSLIPDEGITIAHKANSADEMKALSAKKGHLALRTDTSRTYILTTNDPSLIANWEELLTPPNLVTSVAGKTGVVTLAKADVGLGSVDNTSDAAKNVLSATKLTTARAIALTGDVTGTVNFDGSAGVSIATTLKSSGVTAGTYRSVTVDAKGIVTAATNPTTLAGYGISDAAPIASPTFTGVPKAPTAAANTNNTQIATTEFVTNAVNSKTNITGNAATATKFATARNINGIPFDGTADIVITAAASGGTSAACTGNSATATKLATARKINGTLFDGTSDITITAAANGGNSATVGGFAPATAATANTIAQRDANGYLYAARVYNAVFNDYAELFKKDLDFDQLYTEGTVLVTDGNGKVIPATIEQDSCVIGVVSYSYGHLLGGTEDQNYNEIYYTPVGLAGVIPVRVMGNIKKGDLLYASNTCGVAVTLPKQNHLPGTCIGKALENYNSDSEGMIKMLIMNA